MFKNSSDRHLLKQSTPIRDIKRESTFLRDSAMRQNPNRSLVEQTWEKVEYQFSDLKPSPPAKVTQRKSFLPTQDLEKTFELKSEKMQDLQKQNEVLRQQSYQTLVEALNNNNEKQITTQRNEIFTLRLSVEEFEKKSIKLEERCKLLESNYKEKCQFAEQLENKLLQLQATNQHLEKTLKQREERLSTVTEQLGVLKTNDTHIQEIINEKEYQIEQQKQTIQHLQEQIDKNSYENNKLLEIEMNTWKKKFVELNKAYNIVEEKLSIAQAEMDSACKTRDSIISKTNEIRNTNNRRRTMIVQPFRQQDDDANSNI